MKMIRKIFVVALSLALLLPALAAQQPQRDSIRKIVDQNNQQVDFARMMRDLASHKVVFVSEQHTRFDHHLTQLAILRELHARNPRIGIGVEWFQQGFQSVLDDYVLGKIDEMTMLRKTGYYERWKFDYRLYRPIMTFAREHRLPVIALNAPVEITSKVSSGGLESLTDEERVALPETIHPPTKAYREKLIEVFAMHDLPEQQVERFITVQRIWDETMAQNALDFLKANPDAQLVVFSGIGHISHDAGIPADLARKASDLSWARVMSLPEGDDRSVIAEYVIRSEEVHLPKKGMMGVWLETTDDKRVKIRKVGDESPAAEAGVKKDDIFDSINGQAVRSMTDLKLIMAGKKPGERVRLAVVRAGAKQEMNIILK